MLSITFHRFEIRQGRKNTILWRQCTIKTVRLLLSYMT